MKIACLGWGSLIWRPENLLIQREWFADGPLLPIEFTRQSSDGRLTLVIYNNALPVRTQWAVMNTIDIETAKQSLQNREGIGNKNKDRGIASVTVTEETVDPIRQIIQSWAKNLNIDAVIWTSLPSKFNNIDNSSPTLEQAVQYLNSCDINIRSNAENYIRRAPKQVDTEFRREFEKLWGWTFLKTDD